MAIIPDINYPSKFFLPNPIGRLNPRPVDSTYIWDTLANAQSYATSNPTAYVGQLIFVQENNKLYKIDNAAGNLVEVGAGVGPEVQIATRNTAGIVKVGKHLYVESDGTLHATDTTYNTFSADEAGLVPIAPADQTLFLKSNGTWAAPTFTVPIADRTNLGGVIVGQNLAVTNTGVISLDKAGFLGYWNCETGLATDPTSFYSGTSYTYKKGDYFRAIPISTKYKHTVRYVFPRYDSRVCDVYIYDNSSNIYTAERALAFIPSTPNFYYNVSSGWYAVQNVYGDISGYLSPGSRLSDGVWQSDTVDTLYNLIPSGNTYTHTASTTTTTQNLTNQAIFVYNGSTWEIHDIAQYTLPIATSTLGGIISTTTGTTAGRDYNVEVDPSTGAAKVNVPWTDTNTTYDVFTTTSDGLVPKPDGEGETAKYLRGDGTWQAPTFNIPIATSSTIGGILSQTAGTTTGRDYVVEVDAQGKAKVNVPWIDTVYSLPTASASTLGGIKIGTNLSINSSGVVSATDTTYSLFGRNLNGLVPGTTSTDTTKFLRGDGTWQNPEAVIPIASYSQLGTVKVGQNLVIASDGTLSALDTKYRVFTTSQNGLVPKASASGDTDKYLKGDGTWQAPSFALERATANLLGGIKLGANLVWNTETDRVDATDTTYTVATTAAAGLLPQLLSAHANKFMRADGQWVEVDVSTKQNLVEQIVLI